MKFKVIPLVVTSLLICSCVLRAEELVFDHTSTFMFDTHSILMDLEAEIVDLVYIFEHNFIPTRTIELQWTEDDYYKVADAMNQYVGSGFLEKWQQFGAIFFYECDVSLQGPTETVLYYFQEIGNSRNINDIVIQPAIYKGSVRKTVYEPLTSEWHSFNRQNIISAQTALEIAEKNGGIETRNNAGQVCDVSVSYELSGQPSRPIWLIEYEGDQFDDILRRMEIDVVTGEILLNEQK